MGKKERLRITRRQFYGFALKLCCYGLNDRELKVLLFRYFCKLTLRETGRILNGEVSYETIRQIEKRAFIKIKDNLTECERHYIL